MIGKTLAINLINMFILLLISSTTYADQDIWPGGSCKAANLNQAEKLGWSQWGVENPNPIGGNSYFVLCNVGPKDGVDYDDTSVFYEIGYQKLSPAAADTITCTFRIIDADVTPNNIIGLQTIDVPVPYSTSTITGTFDSNFNHYTIVCALTPQTRLTYIYTN